jgi:hypothetical protein
MNTSAVPAATVSFGLLSLPAATNTLAIPLTIVGDISPSATAKNVSLSLDNNTFLAAKDMTTGGTLGISASGDPTGFPMASELLVIENGDIASTYGNYPNPFQAGTENTTVEFYLASASNVSLILFDIMGKKTATLLDHQSLASGLQRIPWNGKNDMGATVLNGVYYAQLNVNGVVYLLKIAVVK